MKNVRDQPGPAFEMKTPIQRIKCDSLFGRLDYDLDFAAHGYSPIFLYGDNGAGKTTLLRLIYSLLSNTRHEGSKTYISKVPFKRFEIHFINKTSVAAHRAASLTGGVCH
jgi:ABC-type transport system involved in cytochrome c biogenesis ATPase subunit